MRDYMIEIDNEYLCFAHGVVAALRGKLGLEIVNVDGHGYRCSWCDYGMPPERHKSIVQPTSERIEAVEWLTNYIGSLNAPTGVKQVLQNIVFELPTEQEHSS